MWILPYKRTTRATEILNSRFQKFIFLRCLGLREEPKILHHQLKKLRNTARYHSVKFWTNRPFEKKKKCLHLKEEDTFIWWSYQREDMLVGSSCENAGLVTKIKPPPQQSNPVGVPVKVVVDNAWEAQGHVAKKCRVLHDVGISWGE